ncbi:hypothetical protein [Pseudalkalibacillus caeni]|uniref:Uncharacterized protein n=1 Tax=Exobacillus caeni TaxID=2574798 RepID=A0A5R9F7J7_9BACL|nr:hypothetical protein [Pseudalkalibacillus caeni]TLS38230.1 hypothetical protein FCL54_06760 [Pseudalkalibacillus caeni]
MKKLVVFTISLVCFYFIFKILLGALFNLVSPADMEFWAKAQELTKSITLGALINPIELISLVTGFIVAVIFASKWG